jgi:hypothetical protein
MLKLESEQNGTAKVGGYRTSGFRLGEGVVSLRFWCREGGSNPHEVISLGGF